MGNFYWPNNNNTRGALGKKSTNYLLLYPGSIFDDKNSRMRRLLSKVKRTHAQPKEEKNLSCPKNCPDPPASSKIMVYLTSFPGPFPEVVVYP